MDKKLFIFFLTVFLIFGVSSISKAVGSCGDGGTCVLKGACVGTDKQVIDGICTDIMPVCCKTIVSCVSRGGLCTQTSDCCSGLSCSASGTKKWCYDYNLDLADGAVCYDNSECASNFCDAGVCKTTQTPPPIILPPPESCQERGESCGIGNLCCSGLTCGSGVCYDSSKSLPDNSTCYNDSECASGDCSGTKCSPAVTGIVILYDGINYSGAAIGFSIDDENLVDHKWNDKASSIKVASGHQVTLYEHINYGGNSRVITSDTANLGSWSDYVSSIKISTVGGGEEPPQNPPAGSGIISLQNPLEAANFQELLDRLINFFFVLSIAVVPALIIYAGFLYTTSAGNETQINKARDIIKWTVLGFVIILLSKAIIAIIKQVIGIA